MATEKNNVEKLIKRLNSNLSGERSGDRSGVEYVALTLAKTGDKKALSVLIAILYEGGWEQFTKRYPNPELNSYGDYRDHVIKICKALWCLGDPKGIEIAKKRLQDLIEENVKHEVDEWIMTEETEMLMRMKKGLVYSDELYQEINKISEEEHRKDFERREREGMNCVYEDKEQTIMEEKSFKGSWKILGGLSVMAIVAFIILVEGQIGVGLLNVFFWGGVAAWYYKRKCR